MLALVVVHLDHEHRGLSAALALIRNSGQPMTGAAGTVVVDAAVERDRDRALRGRRRAGRNVAERKDRAAVRHAERIEQLIGQLDLDRRAAVLVERDNVHIHQLVQTVRVLTQLEDFCYLHNNLLLSFLIYRSKTARIVRHTPSSSFDGQRYFASAASCSCAFAMA